MYSLHSLSLSLDTISAAAIIGAKRLTALCHTAVRGPEGSAARARSEKGRYVD